MSKEKERKDRDRTIVYLSNKPCMIKQEHMRPR